MQWKNKKSKKPGFLKNWSGIQPRNLGQDAVPSAEDISTSMFDTSAMFVPPPGTRPTSGPDE